MLGYFAIRRRRDLPYSHIFWLFGLFIVACGTTHFMGYYTFYHPIYRLDGLIKLITAWASWGTVLALIPVTPRALAMRSPEQLERIVSERTAALETEVAARKQTEETLRESKADVEQLNTRLQRAMAETHHRVKNNLQVISGLVELQTSTHEQGEATEEFKRIGRHVMSLAAIHNVLTYEARSGGDVEYVALPAALGDMLRLLQETTRGRALRYRLDDVVISVRIATSLSILINELVSNAVKHGEGEIELTAQARADSLKVEVSDSGPGFPPGFDPHEYKHMGLELVEQISRWDLQGSVEYGARDGGGARISVHIPLSDELRVPA